MSTKRKRLLVVRTSLSFFLLCAILFSTGCSRNPAQSTKQTTLKTGDEQPKFSEISTEPSDTGQILALAEAAYAAKDWEVAEKHYVSTTRAIPKEATPWFRLGNIYARTDRPDFAVRAYKEALLRDPEMGKAWYNMGLVQLRQSANSFLQMRTYTQENSEAQIRADTMYEATIALIKDGPKRAKAFPYASGGTVSAPSVDVLPAIQSQKAMDSAVLDSQEQASTEEPADVSSQAPPDENVTDDKVISGEQADVIKEDEPLGDSVDDTEENFELPDEGLDTPQ